MFYNKIYLLISISVSVSVSVFVSLLLPDCWYEKKSVTSSVFMEMPAGNTSATNCFMHPEQHIFSDIDFMPYVVDDSVKFTDVQSLHPDCTHPKLSEVGFNIHPGKWGFDYRDTVYIGRQESQATISNLGTQARISLLPPISYLIPAGQQVSNLSLPTLLDIKYPNGYTLEKVERLTANGGVNGIFESDSNSNTIYYTRKVSEFGWDKLRYTLVGYPYVNGVVEGERATIEDTLTGEVYIIVSRTNNCSVATTVGHPNVSYSLAPALIAARGTAVIDVANECIDIFDSGNGMLFINSPSKAYVDSIGGISTNGTWTETGTSSATADFYLFNLIDANRLCSRYNALNIGGRNNWRLPTRDELKKQLFEQFGNMNQVRGWPTSITYLSSTSVGFDYLNVTLSYGIVSGNYSHYAAYVSCVSTR